MTQPAQPRADVLGALRACRLLRGADEEHLARLAVTARVVSHPRGAVLAAEGEPADTFAVIVSGKARVHHLAADGRAITFETAGAGDPVAAVAALAGSRYPATVEAVTPIVAAWLDREALYLLIDEQPVLARALVAHLAQRVVDVTAVMTSMSMGVPARLAAYLFQRALAVGRTTPEGLVVDLGMSKAELASSLGTVPETLSRALARLRDDGVLQPRMRDVLVKDVGALARIGSGYSEG